MIKRTFDLVLSLTLLAPGAVICFIIFVVYIAIERTNPVFRQTRMGKNEKPFSLYKIRTMAPGAANVGTHQIDPAIVTGVGRFLRRTKLDELPQLLNVIAGDMSFVGPRPALLSQTDVLEARRKRGVYRALPGITGHAQIHGIDMSQPEALAAADEAYLKNNSFWGDIKIIALTAMGSGYGDQIRQQ